MHYKTERINVASLLPGILMIIESRLFCIDIFYRYLAKGENYALPTFLCLYLGSRNFTILIQLDYEKQKNNEFKSENNNKIIMQISYITRKIWIPLGEQIFPHITRCFPITITLNRTHSWYILVLQVGSPPKSSKTK